MSRPPKWGIVSTIKAPLREIAIFAAHHLELGAHRLIIYLDDANQVAFDRLSQHPEICIIQADETNWRRARRPVKHQVRQARNARHAYHRMAQGLDWLAHIDVDEFLRPLNPLSEQLQALPDDSACARTRPIEALSGEGISDIPPAQTCFKAAAHDRATRDLQTGAIYPTYGAQLNGGFLSHVAGKLFARTGLELTAFKIHNIFIGDEQNPGQQELPQTELCHMHAPRLDDWLASFRYRLEKGAYRPELGATRPRVAGGLTMHEFFSYILAEEGEQGLRDFFDEVCRATPDLRARLKARGLLRCYEMDLEAKLEKHFPDLA
ncbi:glycosyltransferase family 2 protein [Alisedimentitalea sp. MJ-SS2]|uniref:glycosyltransferase family 2 protein n=1 Tax=Aliisedimentitalea sp. MJ-SS2 TaxID=3049795 RepID=UPI002908A6DD|nr:glycosyltransferase family 2 protein [Alisedimentitalea sp. MJ-SS2]MDU8929057.1 glycosyltransferase family 2 protein [Alisedimentitalea sp. MJ-SS2]